MDIKAKAEELFVKINEDTAMQEQFSKDPAKTIRDFAGADLTDEEVNQILEGIIGMAFLGAVGGVMDRLSGNKPKTNK